MSYIDLSGNSLPQKALPVIAYKKRLSIKFPEGFNIYRQKPWYSALFKDYFKLWDSLGLYQIPVTIRNYPEHRANNEFNRLQRAYDRYREFKQPFVPPLKTYLCKCGKPEIDEYGLCVSCRNSTDSSQSLLNVAAWLAKNGRIIARTEIVPESPIKKITDIVKLDWDEDTKLKAIKAILEKS